MVSSGDNPAIGREFRHAEKPKLIDHFGLIGFDKHNAVVVGVKTFRSGITLSPAHGDDVQFIRLDGGARIVCVNPHADTAFIVDVSTMPGRLRRYDVSGFSGVLPVVTHVTEEPFARNESYWLAPAIGGYAKVFFPGAIAISEYDRARAIAWDRELTGAQQLEFNTPLIAKITIETYERSIGNTR